MKVWMYDGDDDDDDEDVRWPLIIVEFQYDREIKFYPGLPNPFLIP